MLCNIIIDELTLIIQLILIFFILFRIIQENSNVNEMF